MIEYYLYNNGLMEAKNMTEMNKNIKKLLAILLSAVVIVSGCTVAFGADKSAPASATVSTTGTDDKNVTSDSDGKKTRQKSLWRNSARI